MNPSALDVPRTKNQRSPADQKNCPVTHKNGDAVKKRNSVALFIVFLLICTSASAQLSFHDAATNQGVLDQVIVQFRDRATAWQAVVQGAASWLFWTLGTISFTWTMGELALKKEDIGEFFAEFVRFILFFGFFYWLLQNGPNFADSIIQSLRKIGDNAAGTTGLSPSGIVDIGFMIWKQAIKNLSFWTPVDSFVGIVLSAGILILLAVVAVNILLLVIAAWILSYAGLIFLGFGGSKWTSDLAINYFRTILCIAVQLFVMILLVGIGNNMLSSFYDKMTLGTLNFEELGVMMVFCLALLLLVAKIPPLVSGIVTGGGTTGGVGNFGSSALIGAGMASAGMIAATAAAASAAVTASAAHAAGGMQALTAAASKSYNESDFNQSMGDRSVVSPDGMTRTDATGTWPNAEGIYNKIYADEAKAEKNKAGSSVGSGDKTSGGSPSSGTRTPSTSSASNTKSSGTASSPSLSSIKAGSTSQQSASSAVDAGSISAASYSDPGSKSTTNGGSFGNSSNGDVASELPRSGSVPDAASDATSTVNDGETHPDNTEYSHSDTPAGGESDPQSSSDTEGNSGQSSGDNTKKQVPSTASTVKDTALKAGRLLASTAANLAQGTYDIGNAKFGEMKENARNRISETTGGKIASAIKRREEASKHNEAVRSRYVSSVPADNMENTPLNREEEIAAFRDKYMSEDLDNDEPA